MKKVRQISLMSRRWRGTPTHTPLAKPCAPATPRATLATGRATPTSVGGLAPRSAPATSAPTRSSRRTSTASATIPVVTSLARPARRLSRHPGQRRRRRRRQRAGGSPLLPAIPTQTVPLVRCPRVARGVAHHFPAKETCRRAEGHPSQVIAATFRARHATPRQHNTRALATAYRKASSAS